jgi:hypothetical protein
MATKRKSVVRRVRYAARRVSRRRSSYGGGMFGGLIGHALAGVAAGVGAQVASRFLGPTYGAPLAYAGVGYVAKNDTLMTLAGISASSLIPVGSVLGGSNGGSSGAI